MIGTVYTIDFQNPALSGKSPFQIAPGDYDGPDLFATNPQKCHTSINLFGMGYLRYGEKANENWIRLLEHFANNTPPILPTIGQLWFDSGHNLLKVYDTTLSWSSISGISQTDADLRYLQKTGGTMSGDLTLNADPTTSLGAATKLYVDTLVTNTTSNYLPLTGGTLLGNLTLHSDPTTSLGAATKQYVDVAITGAGTVAGNTYVKLSGSTMSGLLILSANPTANLGAATKQYVDSLANRTLTLNGDVTGTVTPSGTGTITVSTTLAPSGVAAGSYGNIQELVIDNSGRITSVLATPWDATNPMFKNKVYKMFAPTSAWLGSGSICYGVGAWNTTTPSTFTNSFVPIYSSTYRNHPMYSAGSGWYSGLYPYASTLCGQNIFTFTCPQTCRVNLNVTSNHTFSGSTVTVAGHYVKMEKYVGGTWVIIPNSSDGRWGQATDSTGTFSGYVSVDAQGYSVDSPPGYTKAWNVTFPNDYSMPAYYTSTGSVFQDPFEWNYPALPANTPIRVTIQAYAMAQSSWVTLTKISLKTIFTVIGE